jgi:hypothetical protein
MLCKYTQRIIWGKGTKRVRERPETRRSKRQLPFRKPYSLRAWILYPDMDPHEDFGLEPDPYKTNADPKYSKEQRIYCSTQECLFPLL